MANETNSKGYYLDQCMRWYGPRDVVTLDQIAQAGCTGVVSALHDVPVGEIWEKEAIQDYKRIVESRNLEWAVVESLPVHEDIKARTGKFEEYIHNYRMSLANLAECGIRVVTYNFMPVLDWTRTDIQYRLPNGGLALRFDKTDMGVFDLFLIQRPGAKDNYTESEREAIEERYNALGNTDQERLFKTVMMGLPGANVPLTPEYILQNLGKYENVDHDTLRANLISFLADVAPVAEDVGISLALHPDDPPFPVLGLPRVVSTASDLDAILESVPVPASGLCFCTGSLGARKDNDVLAMLRKWGERVHFLHLRNTVSDESGNFHESEHLGGDTDMFQVMQEVVDLTEKTKRHIPMRPDHGHQILDDLGKATYPGYSAIGRLKGLAELRGLEYAIRRGSIQ